MGKPTPACCNNMRENSTVFDAGGSSGEFRIRASPRWTIQKQSRGIRYRVE